MFESLEDRRLMSAAAVGRDWIKTSYWTPSSADVRLTEEVAFSAEGTVDAADYVVWRKTTTY